jgi:sortase A
VIKAKVIWLVGLIGLASFVYGAYIPIKAELAQYLIHRAWDESIDTGTQIKPWGWADMHPVLRLQSENHNQDLIVLAGDTGNVLAFGPGLSGETPYLDDSSSLLISAHRDTHFSFLQDITIGDKFTTTAADNTDQSYQVSSIEIIDTAKQDIYIQDNQPQLILVTCYPFNAVVAGGTLRYVVISKLIG